MTLASVRDIVRDDREWGIRARVAVHAGETSHFVVNDEGQIQVSVVTSRGQEINTLLSLDADNDGTGIFRIPKPGTEVFVTFDEGNFEGDAYLVGKFANLSGNVPEDLGAAETIIQDTIVIIRDNLGGTAAALATLRDMQAQMLYLRKQFDSISGHHHATVGGPPIEATTATGTSSVPTPAGTTILMAQ